MFAFFKNLCVFQKIFGNSKKMLEFHIVSSCKKIQKFKNYSRIKKCSLDKKIKNDRYNVANRTAT